ncbi:astacin-like metalloprotease toxin 5 isoform X2 [Brevipalpus obovatus]|uniref:astacin-like metalloprotease toxin 5 isoform X2 n=1 Tax=Brevipalpus obovatus TaxID=246614 RepID=UPI003D9F9B1A
MQMNHIFTTLISFILIINNIWCSPVRRKNETDSLPKPLEDAKFFLGDILLTQHDNSNLNSKSPLVFRNALKVDDNLWSYATIPIEIDPILSEIGNQIVSALEEYHMKSCIRFVERNEERDYIRFIYDDGCYSSVGRIGGMQTVSLGNGCHCRGTIIHELMHALGFYHEHNRSDRDDYVEIISENIKPGLESMFLRLSPRENRLLTPYDYDSISHYDGEAFGKGGSQTMIPKDPKAKLKHPCEKNELSVLDIEKLNGLYQCDK